MISLFNEQPLMLQWLPGLDRGVVLGVNRIGQVLIVIAAVMGIYQENALVLIRHSMQTLSFFVRAFADLVGWRWVKDEIGFGFPPETRLTDKQLYEDFAIGWQFSVSAILLFVLLMFTSRGPFGWLAYAFEVAWRGITIWAQVEPSFGLIVTTLAGSVGRLLVFFPLLILAMLACAIVARPYAFLFSQIAERLSPGHYRLAIFVVLSIGSLFVMTTT